MKQKMLRFFLLFLVALMGFTSCSFNKLMKSSDNEKKYTAALAFYQKEQYSKALSLFDDLATVYRGSNRSENIHYYIAECYYNLGQYYLAGYYYKEFTRTYPTSTKAEECAFKAAYCSYLNSPKPSLDQTETKKAIDEFQLFLNRYPQTALKDSANTMIDELRLKLEEKQYQIARLYYITEDYKAAAVALVNLAKQFPNSPHMEEIKFLTVKSRYKLAMNSVQSKKEERLQATVEAYHDFIDTYSSSKHIKEAEGYYADAIEELNNVNTIN